MALAKSGSDICGGFRHEKNLINNLLIVSRDIWADRYLASIYERQCFHRFS